MFILTFFWKRTEPRYYGRIDRDMIQPDSDDCCERSLRMKCERCGKPTKFVILESWKKWDLFFIPLGKSDYEYDVFCEECGLFQMRFGSRELFPLLKKGVVIEELEKTS